MSQIKPIDIHAHLFNLRYLPLRGILQDSGLISMWGPFARALEKILLHLTEKDRSLDDTPSALAMPIRAPGQVAASIAAALADFEAYIATTAADVPDDLLFNSDVEAALRVEPGSLNPSALDDPAAHKPMVLGQLIEGAQTFRNGGWRRTSVSVRPIKWLFAVATQRERDIVSLLQDTFPDVDIFVHHMMDLEQYYQGAPNYEFTMRQIRRMRNLSAVHSQRFLTFVAWCPFRNDGIEIIKNAVRKYGCVGVKFYPPSGYRPVGNTDEDFTRHPRFGPAPEIIERRNMELFRWCVDKDVPIFAHCSPGGFESFNGAGMNSDPKYWKRLLETDGLSGLRLCLGHAGGDAWFARDDAEFDKSFAKGVFDICADGKYPNVYCGVGILDHVKTDEDLQVLHDRLARLIGDKAQFADRILYGTDWHMLYLKKDHEKFLDNYRRLFSTGVLKKYAKGFFRNNAVRYLNLGRSYVEPLPGSEQAKGIR